MLYNLWIARFYRNFKLLEEITSENRNGLLNEDFLAY